MGILRSNVRVYEFDPFEIGQLIAADLGEPVERVQVEFVIKEVGGDPMGRLSGRNEVVAIKVTVRDPV